MKPNKYIIYVFLLLAGLSLGWLIFGNRSTNNNADEHLHEHSEKEVWTCSMHPQIKMDEPGKCPLCAMDLIPLKSSGDSSTSVDSDAIVLSEEAIALANIQTTVVSRSNPVKEIQLYGVIKVDERSLQSQSSHINGRIEKLFVNYTGEKIIKGQKIATVYSPDLLSAQQELIESVKLKSTNPALLQSARDKLKYWKISDKQIENIEKSGIANPYSEIYSNSGGVVISRNVSQGDYINQGSVILNVADLTKVWALFDVFESDLPYLKIGDILSFTLNSVPGKTFSGKISFIDPLIDNISRTTKVRVEVSNKNLLLKPEMYATGKLTSSLSELKNEIVIPSSAVLWTGKRSVVYVKHPGSEPPAFMLREIELGNSLGNSYHVISGLSDGEEIVTNGAYSVDASAQLEGKPSMMNMNNKVSSDKIEKLTVEGLCDMCRERIESTAKGVEGVVSAKWDSETKILVVKFSPDKTDLQAISKAVAIAGHDTKYHKTAKATYDNLPGCCKYRD